MFAEPWHARTHQTRIEDGSEKERDEESRSGLIVFSACVLAARNVDGAKERKSIECSRLNGFGHGNRVAVKGA